MLNILIPMAGRGSRFLDKGYSDPKPLIKIFNRRMIEVVHENLSPSDSHRFIFICQKEHVEKYDLKKYLSSLSSDVEIVQIDGVTDGAACTALFAEDLINSDEPLMIANSDQFIDFKIDDYLVEASNDSIDGLIMTMKANDPKWSYVQVDGGFVNEVREKEVISNEATVGIYNFKHGSDFVRAAKQMIKDNARSNGEFYVAPVYNYLISEGATIGIYNIGSEQDGMYGLGTPDDLEIFLSKGEAFLETRI